MESTDADIAMTRLSASHGMEVVAMAQRLWLLPWHGLCCRHGVANRLSASHGSEVVAMAQRLSASHGMDVVAMAQRLSASHGVEVVAMARGCWHGMEVVAMAWLMLSPWRG